MQKRILISELLAEFIGSMFLVMAAISPIILFTLVLESHISVAIVANAIAVAFVLCALIEMFGPVSGAHFNPVVTVVMWIHKNITAGKAALFLSVQVVGGILGTVFSHLMFYEEMGGLLFVSDQVRNGHIYFGEVVGTFILVLAILVLVKIKSTKIPIMIGLLVGGQLLSTSSTMFANPQVTIARIFTSSVSGIRPFDAMIFIVMQFIGGLLAYGVYKLVFSKYTTEFGGKQNGKN